MHLEKHQLKPADDKHMLPFKENILELIPSTHGGLIRKTSQQYSIPLSDIVDFSASLNPLGSPFDNPEWDMDLQDLFATSFEKMGQYPDNRYLEYRAAAAFFVGGGADAVNIVPGNGSSEIIRLVAGCILNEGDEVMIPQPTFAEYEQQCRVAGAKIVYYPVESLLSISEDALESARILFVCNPNNPTGKLLAREDILRLAGLCAETGTLLFVDEAFIELSDISSTVVDVAISNDHVFVMRSLTKSFALPGIRMGFGVASETMAEKLNTARLPWNMGSLAEEVGCSLMGMEGGMESAYLNVSRQKITEYRDYLVERLNDIYGFHPHSSSVNYILVDISELLMDSVELTERLARHGVLIRDCSSFPLMENDFIRLAVRPPEETDILIHTIGEVLTESGKDYAEEKLKETIKGASCGCSSSRNTCEYYPCHFEGQDCTFCFCPFYPCEDTRTGGKWIDSTTGSRVWSCEDCVLVHNSDVVHKMLNILMEDGGTDVSLKKAWDEVIGVGL
ncbi:threonine-phosphate decarboxylase CobD [Methanohalophilus sp. WG1-DM]|uniref:threonine-phosphate decarboxylase CobD n=1 Tax=Methanohalophilus sp. WG1-DM TaxID=2491675 RepID=UPI000FFEE4FE|nr:threonine-phosphate decarboxylase CobD [Methanohalophilus sp. WG1-DM]RXG34309.1 threonine-phosphate decarboxylase [Methanohalophilus sp. WG1-DM]